jgi:NAD(P)H-dependent FMN reductase
MTLRVARNYKQVFEEAGAEVQLLSLEGVQVSDPAVVKQLEQQYLIPTQKFVLVMPEYNGSFPGILKYLMDSCDIRHCWWYKKAMLVGLADGRAGNLRGLDHMTNVLNYLKVTVLPNKIPISQINRELDENGAFTQELTINVVKHQVREFLEF